MPGHMLNAAGGETQLEKSQCYLLDMDQTLARYRTPAVYEVPPLLFVSCATFHAIFGWFG